MCTFNLQEDIDKENYLANKLDSISIFSQGFAHDFNNILTLIMGNITLAKIKMNESDKAIEILSEVEQVCDRAKDLVQQLSVLSTDSILEKKRVSITETIKYAAKFCLRGTKIRYKIIVQDQVCYVKANEGQLFQVFTNLILNAVQAMPDGGDLVFKLENIFIDKHKNIPLNHGFYVRVDITDSGVGIPPGNISKIFEPFFTTKETGKGLGLAITRSIINNHDGFISIDSRVGIGTTFYIFIPAYF